MRIFYELKRWTEEWLVNFHPEKSKYMRTGQSETEDKGYHMDTNINKTMTEKTLRWSSMTSFHSLNIYLKKSARQIGLWGL